MRDKHQVRVDREAVGRVDLETTTTVATVYTALPCLIEPLGGRQQTSVFGVVPGARLNISWRSSAGTLLDNDRVLYGGSWWIVQLVRPDTGVGSRMMRRSTAVLERADGLTVGV